MDDDLLKFVLDGAPDRHGNIPAEVFLAKLRLFITTMYSFDRAFAKKSRKSIELEVVDLKRVNPAIMSFRPKAQVAGYDAAASVSWSIDQFAKIHDNQAADMAVPQDALDNVVELARIRQAKIPLLRGVRVEYRGVVVAFDEKMEGNALALRSTRQITTESLWHSGVSKGSIFGELRGVMDLDGERQFFIAPPSGADKIQCLFPEEMRQDMNDNLFQVVRVHGYLRFDGKRPTPIIVEAERIEGIPAEPTTKHFSDLLGAFREFEAPENGEFA
jgi:hypothetical protein